VALNLNILEDGFQTQELTCSVFSYTLAQFKKLEIAEALQIWKEDLNDNSCSYPMLAQSPFNEHGLNLSTSIDAPYNHQVSKLRTALGEQAKIGSVDKFQGQEAPVVVLSMCASDASESPRGMDFLLDKHRLNVAISRAQTLAIVVGNPRLSQTPVNRVDQLKLVSLFSSVVLGEHQHRLLYEQSSVS
jgi:hypothetical protein